MGWTKYSSSAAIFMAAIIGVGAAHAQTWPSRPIMLVVPFAAGGGTDAFARPLAQQLDKQLNTRVLIENRAGAGGTTGAAAAAKAPADGYTFFVGAAHHAIAPSIYPRLEYDLEKDFIPIGMIARPPQVIVVNPKLPAMSLKELLQYARANPDKLNYASAGNGTTHHLAGELFKVLTKTKIRHVPYRGAGPAMQDLIAGHVDLEFDGLGSSAAQISDGQIRALAVASRERSPTLPDVPTAEEAGLKGFEVSTWYALWAPQGTPADIVARMKNELSTALKDPGIKEAWKRSGSDVPSIMGPEFGNFVSAEIRRWGAVVNQAGVKLD